MAWFSNSQLKSKDPHRRIEALGKLGDARDAQSVNSVLAAVSDPVVEVRIQAMAVSVRWRDENTLRVLLHLLRDPHPAVRERAIAELRPLGAKQCVTSVVICLKDPVSAVRIQAVHTLTFFGWAPQTPEERALDLIAHGHFAQAVVLGDVALDLLLSFVDDPSSSTRREVAEAFGVLRSPRVIAALQKLLSDIDPAVRIAAVTSLGRLQCPVAIIAPIARDPAKNVRIAAVESLGDMKDTEAVPLLIDALADEQWDVRCAAAKALGALGQRTSVQHLAAGLQDSDPDVRIACADALAAVGDVDAIEPLIMAQLDVESSVRQAALNAAVRVDFRWHRNPRAYRTLLSLKRAVRAGDFTVQNAATELMDRIFGIKRRAYLVKSNDFEADRRARAAEILIPCLWDDDALLRSAAAETLGALRCRRAADVLRVATEDGNEQVRNHAADALQALESGGAGAAGWQPSQKSERAGRN